MSWPDIARRIRDIGSFQLFPVGETWITPLSIVQFLIVVLASVWLSRLVRRVADRWFRGRGLADEGTIANSLRLLHYGIMVVGIGIGLQIIGIELGALFAAGAVAAVAIGFAMQNILQNFVSGIILLAERSITESDVLEVDGRIVKVVQMGTRATVARTRDEEELIIPNSVLVQSTVTNHTLGDTLYRIRTKVGVAYGSDMDRVFEVLMEAGRSVEDRVEEREPIILLLEFGDSSVVFEVSVWATDPWRARVTRSHLNMAVWRYLKEAGITIAFPQLDVHFEAEEFAKNRVAGLEQPK